MDSPASLSRSKSSDVTGGVMGYLELRYYAWQVRLLLCSSVLLSIPSVLAARHDRPVLSLLCGTASLASLNYWRNSTVEVVERVAGSKKA